MSADEKNTIASEPAAKRPKNTNLRQLGPLLVDERDYPHANRIITTLHRNFCGRENGLTLDEITDCVVTLDEKHRVSALDFSGKNHSEFGALNFMSGCLHSIFHLDCLQSLYLWAFADVTSLNGLGNLRNLVSLRIRSLQDLRELPDDLSSLRKLKSLTINNSWQVSRLPALPPDLISLDISMTSISQISDSIEGLTQLKHFKAKFCRFTRCPIPLGSMRSLELLCLSDQVDPSPAALPREVAEFASLKTIHTTPRDLTVFPASMPHTKELHLSCETTGTETLNGGLRRLKKWRGVQNMYLTINSHLVTDLHSHFSLAGWNLESFRRLQMLYLEHGLPIGHTGKSIGRLRLPLEDLLHCRQLKALNIKGFNIVSDENGFQDKMSFPKLKYFSMDECSMDPRQLQRLDMPTLRALSIMDLDLSGDILEVLCDTWIRHLPHMTSLSLLRCNITFLSERCIEILGTLTLRMFSLQDNPILDASIEKVEEFFVPLLDVCNQIGCCGTVRFKSDRLHYKCFHNEARPKVLGGQVVPRSLWPMILEKPQLPFRPKKYKTVLIPEADGVYALLRKRVALEVFGEDTHSGK